MQAAAVASSGSPPELSLAEGRLWCELIERRCGLHFPESQWRYLRRQLWERMRESSISSYAEYYGRIAEAGRSEEWRLLMEGLLNAETSFFRHRPSFAALESILRARKTGAVTRPYEIWSAGCSTGEEAYSLAMTASAATGGQSQVVGADLNRKALDAARAGVYADRQVSEVSPEWRSRFLRQSARAGFWEIAEVIRAQVRFEAFHLLDSSTYPKREFDAIFCFNVLIYFAPAARQQAAAGLLGRLKPGGHLFMAPGESAGLVMTGAEAIRVEGTHIWRRAS